MADSYKAGQGSLARLLTAIGCFIVAFLGCVELYSWIRDQHDVALVPIEVFRRLPVIEEPLSWKLLLCGVLFAGAVWGIRVLLTRPKTVDALIETEAELKKVSWPTREESWNASLIVIFITILITATLFVFDFVIRSVLDFII